MERDSEEPPGGVSGTTHTNRDCEVILEELPGVVSGTSYTMSDCKVRQINSSDSSITSINFCNYSIDASLMKYFS